MRMAWEVISLDTRKRLIRKPFTTLLWLVFVALMTGFLTAAASLWFSTAKLADTLDKNHTAIAVRSDPGVVKHSYSIGSVTWETEGRTFTEQDAEAIAAMPGVKAVRSHTFAGGSSPAFQPFIDVQRQLSWNAKGNADPYHDAVFAGKLVAVHDGGYTEYSGEQQRVAIARALAAGNELILADEPTGNLDITNGDQIVSILLSLAHEENRCVIIVTHDLEIAAEADEILMMKDGVLEREQ